MTKRLPQMEDKANPKFLTDCDNCIESEIYGGKFCSLHESAPSLLEACKALRDNQNKKEKDLAWQQMLEAIKQAEGK
jgi:hypothetical protein